MKVTVNDVGGFFGCSSQYPSDTFIWSEECWTYFCCVKPVN